MEWKPNYTAGMQPHTPDVDDRDRVRPERLVADVDQIYRRVAGMEVKLRRIAHNPKVPHRVRRNAIRGLREAQMALGPAPAAGQVDLREFSAYTAEVYYERLVRHASMGFLLGGPRRRGAGRPAARRACRRRSRSSSRGDPDPPLDASTPQGRGRRLSLVPHH